MIDPPFPVGFEFAPGSDLAAPGPWQYQDLTGRRRQSAPIEFEYGQPDESGSVEAGSGAVTFDDRDAELSPWNPYSTWYGQLLANVPARVRIPLWYDDFDRAAAASTWGTSSSGHVWSSASGLVSLSGNGTALATFPAANGSAYQYLRDSAGVGVGSRGVNVHVQASLDAATVTGSVMCSPIVRRVESASLNSTSYFGYFRFHPSGFIQVQILRNISGAGTVLGTALTTVAWSAGKIMHFEFEADGPVLRARAYADGGSPPAWQVTAVENKSDGWSVGLLLWRESGEASAGTRVLTVYDVRVDAIPWSGYAADLPPAWDKSGEDSTTMFELAGPLRTLTALNSDEQARSPLYWLLLGYAPSGFWPCEDDAGARFAGSAIGGPAAETSGVSFGNDGFAGQSSSAKFDEVNGKFFARASTVSPQQFAVMLTYKLPAAPAADTLLYEWLSPSGTARRWQIWGGAVGFRVLVVNSIGNTLSDTGYFNYVVNPTHWLAMQLEATVSAGTVSYTLLYTEVGVNVFWSLSGSFSGSLTGVQYLQMNCSTSALVDTQWGMVYMGAETLPFVADSFIKVANGYATELAADRHDRLTSNNGVASAALPGDTIHLGVQAIDTFPTLLTQTTASGEGLQLEFGPGLQYIPLNSRYNTVPIFELEWSSDDGTATGGDLAQAPKPAAGDQRYVSQYTVKRVGGSEATWFADAATVALRGRKPGSKELSLADDPAAAQHAGWRGNAAVWPELRWPELVVDLLAHPELIDAVMRVRVGSRFTVAGMKAQVFGQEIDLVVEAVHTSVGRHEWTVTLACAPARIYDVAIYDDNTRLKDSRTSTLNAAAGPGDPTIVITFTDLLDQWSQTNEPYSLLILGEEVVVTNMAAVVGSGPWTQTATVRRAENGIGKQLPAGTPVHIHPRVRARYAL